MIKGDWFPAKGRMTAVALADIMVGEGVTALAVGIAVMVHPGAPPTGGRVTVGATSGVMIPGGIF
jgi:hypothetical protein